MNKNLSGAVQPAGKTSIFRCSAGMQKPSTLARSMRSDELTSGILGSLGRYLASYCKQREPNVVQRLSVEHCAHVL